MNLGELLQTRQEFDKLMKQKTLEMDVWFQNYLWDGYSDENDPHFISTKDFEAIQALSDKMLWMATIIGCPTSIAPMLESIISRKVKHWINHNTYYNDYKRGKKLNTKDEINRAKKQGEFAWQNDMVVKGHFRWNWKTYMLSRRATDLLEEWYSENF